MAAATAAPASVLTQKAISAMAKSSGGSRTTLHGRNADTGRFVPVKTARNHPSTHVVERVPKPGFGDTKKK
jgi:hypothetical protein